MTSLTESKQDFETGIAVVFIFIVFFSIVFNVLVISALLLPKYKLRFRDKLIVSMSFCDLTRIVITGPLEIRGLLNHRFGENGEVCKVISFFMYFCEYSSIAHLTLLVIDRYICTCQPHVALKIYMNHSIIYIEIVGAYCFGLFWALLPIMGLGRYGFQIPLVQCGLEPLHDVKTKAYITLILVCVNILSLVVAFTCIYKIWKKIKQTDQEITEFNGSAQAKEMLTYIQQDKQQLNMVLGLTFMFVCTWLVYDVGLFEEIYTTNARNEYLEVSTTCIGQSSAVIAPILCMLFYNEIRVTLKRFFTKSRIRNGQRSAETTTPPKTSNAEDSSSNEKC